MDQERVVSPDGALTLLVRDGGRTIGFEGGSWHTHPDLLSHWLGVPVARAVAHFIELVTTDRLPILLSTDGGKTVDPWVSDALNETIRLHGASECVLRYWTRAGAA